MVYDIRKGDCLELMKKIPDKSIDMILCDLPYGTTDCKWDTIIPFDKLWEQYRRIIKLNGAIVLFSAQPFTTKLIQSNFENYKYNWYWKKNNATGGQFAKVQPMRCIEDICVFRYDLSKDNKGYFMKCREYLNEERNKCGKTMKELQQLTCSFMISHYFTNGGQFRIPTKEAYQKLQTTGYFSMPYDELLKMYEQEKNEITKGETFTYNPQGLVKLDKPKINKFIKSNIFNFRSNRSIQEYTNYPKHILEFKNEESGNRNRLHPTQKPVTLLEYLIKTYTNENETVLDNCMGSGSTGVACINTNRQFIGFELDDGYFDIATKRLQEAKEESENNLFALEG